MDDAVFEEVKLILQQSSRAIPKIHERFGYDRASDFRQDFKEKAGSFPYKYRLEFARSQKQSKNNARQHEIENAIKDVQSMVKSSKIAPIDLYKQIVDKTHHIKEFLALFKKKTGMSVQEYHKKYGEVDDETNRVKAAKVLLVDTNDSMRAIAKTLGYKKVSCLSHHFKNKVGIAPSYYRRDMKAAAVRDLMAMLQNRRRDDFNKLDLAS